MPAPDSRPARVPFQEAMARAKEALSHRPVASILQRCGGAPAPGGLTLRYFGAPLTVTLPEGLVVPELMEMERLLVLHYLASDAAVPPDTEWVSFKQLPGASFYEPAYRRRATSRLLAVFGQEPELLVAASERLGGRRAELADVSVRIEVLPRIPALVVLHRGDEEFPPEAGILFPRTVAAYLSLEDVAVLSGVIASRLKRALR